MKNNEKQKLLLTLVFQGAIVETVCAPSSTSGWGRNLYSNDNTPLSKKKELTADICNKMEESHRHRRAQETEHW